MRPCPLCKKSDNVYMSSMIVGKSRFSCSKCGLTIEADCFSLAEERWNALGSMYDQGLIDATHAVAVFLVRQTDFLEHDSIFKNATIRRIVISFVKSIAKDVDRTADLIFHAATSSVKPQSLPNDSMTFENVDPLNVSMDVV